ncbi:MAG TPA: peptidoglycan-associated lipoprotein Pal [Gallionella sp.]|nr:peptidoglycan-associated lipoprotein Pal [Gallionella sp.]
MKKHLITLALLGLLAACASDKSKEASGTSALTRAPIDDRSSSSSSSTAADSNADSNNVTQHNPESTTESSNQPSNDTLNDPNSLLAKRSVYFPFDTSAIQDSDIPLVQAHAKYLAGHGEQKVSVEGNTDERGSNEYNLALGQRRADSVKKMLELGGANSGQISAVSYGEEKPKATGHDETSWAQNRRADLDYK